jgi:hypothetical protein
VPRAGQTQCTISVVDEARALTVDGHAWSESFNELLAQFAASSGALQVCQRGAGVPAGLCRR